MQEQIPSLAPLAVDDGPRPATLNRDDRATDADISRARTVGEPLTAGRRVGHAIRGPQSEAAACAMQTYWSASGRSRTIDALLARTTDPVEQQALRELLAAEDQRGLVARDALAELFGFELTPPAKVTAIPKEVIPWTQRRQT